MGYFNINSILYNFRKIFKYLSISLAFISFIILALLLMTRDVKASSTPTPTSSIVLPSFPAEAYNYDSRVVWIRSNGGYRLVCCNSTPVYSSALNELRFESSGCSYIYTPGVHTDWVFDYDFPYVTYNFGGATLIYSSMNIYYTGTWDIYYPASSSEPTEPSYREPFIALPNDTTQAYISGEFSQFMVIGNDDIEDLQFFLTANPDVLPTTNSLALNLDDDSPYYLNNFEAEDGGKYYLIPKYDLPQGYTNDTPYHAWLAYRYHDHVYLTDVIEWTTNFTAKAIENDRIRLDSGMADSLSDVRSFLFNNKVNYGDYNLPNITFDFDQEHFLSDLFENIRQAFIGNTYTDFEFTFPFSNETITIPSNYVELHCPSIIVNLIRLFYWYIIGRYILKDVFRTIDKMRQGDWFLRSDGNIKTEVL